MAVAVKNSPETSSGQVVNRLAVGSLAGAAYVLAGLVLIFYGLPTLWWGGLHMMGQKVGTPGGWALLILIMVAVAVGWLIPGGYLASGHPVRGVRAGVFVALVGLLVAFLVTCAVGRLLEMRLGYSVAGAAVTVAIGVLFIIGLVAAFFRGRVDSWLVAMEEQGWFTTASYKRTQGQRVRRGTILGILVIAGCGIYTLQSHDTLKGAGNWVVRLPFVGRSVPLLPQVEITLPLVLAAGALWLAYRIVNLPVFADFLIATEAELNKVSWTTRSRLVQDTIVVLVTVVLLTVFLFVVDQAWAWGLTRVGVLQKPPDATAPVQREQPW